MIHVRTKYKQLQFTRLHHQVVAHGTDSKDRIAIVILVTVVMFVSAVILVAAKMLQLCHYVTVVLQISYQLLLNN